MKNIIIPCIICIVLLIGASGCIQNGDQHETNTIFIVSYSVETYDINMTKLGAGFVHNESAQWYLINGTVKQTMGRQIPTIRINLSFFSGNGTFLYKTFTHVYNVPNNQKESFSLKVHLDYFEEIEKVSFELSET